MKYPVERSYTLHGGYPWIVEIQARSKKFGEGIEIEESMTLGEIEKKFNLKDGDSILELRALRNLHSLRKTEIGI